MADVENGPRGPLREYKTPVSDNSRWERFVHRPGDIFVCTPPKAGTTWMQTIVATVLFPDGVPDVVNVLLVHFNDMKTDLEGQMRRVAAFLGVEIADGTWPSLVERCTFDSMRSRSDEIADFDRVFEGGAQTFLYKGTNDRWRGVLTD